MLTMLSYSQSKQDLFVIKMLENKRNGTYVEVGGNDPMGGNNTYLLEKEFDWSGFSVELDTRLADQYNLERRNFCHAHDALTFDFKSEIAKMLNGGTQVDYLSIDIEPARQTLECLKNLPHDKYRFSVITFENEMYYDGTQVRDECREFLEGLGYQLVIGGVKNQGNPYEDWFVDPAVVKESVWRPYLQNDVEDSQIDL